MALVSAVLLSLWLSAQSLKMLKSNTVFMRFTAPSPANQNQEWAGPSDISSVKISDRGESNNQLCREDQHETSQTKESRKVKKSRRRGAFIFLCLHFVNRKTGWSLLLTQVKAQHFNNRHGYYQWTTVSTLIQWVELMTVDSSDKTAKPLPAHVTFEKKPQKKVSVKILT